MRRYRPREVLVRVDVRQCMRAAVRRGDGNAPAARQPSEAVRAGVVIAYKVHEWLVGMVAINAPQAFTAGMRAMMTAEPQPEGLARHRRDR